MLSVWRSNLPLFGDAIRPSFVSVSHLVWQVSDRTETFGTFDQDQATSNGQSKRSLRASLNLLSGFVPAEWNPEPDQPVTSLDPTSRIPLSFLSALVPVGPSPRL